MSADSDQRTDLEQLVARLERPLPADGSPREDGADVVVGPHLLPLLHVHGALQGDPQPAVPLALPQKGHLEKGKSNRHIGEGERDCLTFAYKQYHFIGTT